MADKFNLPAQKFLSVAKCESGLVSQQSKIIRKDGTRENSWGIWQIHLTAHPDITRAQAMNIIWSTNWAAKEWQKGNETKWTCYNNFY